MIDNRWKMWVELSSNFCHLSDIIGPPLRTNSLYEKPTVVFLPHMPYGCVRLARFTCEDHTYGASRLPKMSENDCFAVYRIGKISILVNASQNRKQTNNDYKQPKKHSRRRKIADNTWHNTPTTKKGSVNGPPTRHNRVVSRSVLSCIIEIKSIDTINATA